MVSDRAKEMLRPAIEALLSPADLNRSRSVDAALDRDGNVFRDALVTALPWSRFWWYLATPTVGTNVDAMHALPQGCVVRHVDVRAKVAPASGQLQLEIATGSGPLISVSLQPGMNVVSVAVNEPVAAGSVLSLNLISVQSATGLTVSVFTAPYGGA